MEKVTYNEFSSIHLSAKPIRIDKNMFYNKSKMWSLLERGMRVVILRWPVEGFCSVWQGILSQFEW